MKYVNASDTTHNIKLILREFISTEYVKLDLYNEFTQINTEISNNIFINYVDGITALTFNYTFKVGDSFQFKIFDGDVIGYRGKIKAI